MSDSTDRINDLEADIAWLKLELATSHEVIADLRLDLRRMEEKIEVILLKLVAPRRFEEIYGCSAENREADVRDEVRSLLDEFLARRRR